MCVPTPLYPHATGCNTIPNCEDVASAASDPAQPDATEIEGKRLANRWLHANGLAAHAAPWGTHAGVKASNPKSNYEAKPISSFVFIKLSKRKPNSADVSRGDVYQACNRMQHDPKLRGWFAASCLLLERLASYSNFTAQTHRCAGASELWCQIPRMWRSGDCYDGGWTFWITP